MEINFIILLVLLGTSASFSSFETALFSLSPLQRHRFHEMGGVSSLMTRMLERPREFLTTVLLGNELVNVAIGILSGGIAFNLLGNYGEKTVYIVSTALTTMALLVVGEIIPKNIAVRNPVFVSQFIVVPYQIFFWLVFPFRVVLTKITDRIVQLFGADPKAGRRLIVEEELRSLLDLGRREGTLADLERSLIQNALDLSTLPVSEIMIPRDKMVAIPVETPLQAVFSKLQERRYSRIPVYEQTLDRIVGVLYAKETLPYRILPASSILPSLREILKPSAEVKPDESLGDLFQDFQEQRIHMAIVRDKDGKVAGLVTMDDLLEKFIK